MWLACASGIALMISSGGLLATTATDWWYTCGRALGIVAAVLMMTQVLLASRAPWIERVLGHDQAIAKHTRLGKVAIVLLIAHALTVTVTTGVYENREPVRQLLMWQQYGWFMLFAQIALAVFVVVWVTSVAAVRLRWPYERWYAVHMAVYVGVAFAVPHQFLEGSTFRMGGFAWWFWAVLWAVSIGSFVAFRVVRPWWLLRRHGLTVESVVTSPSGVTSVTFTGRTVARLGAQAGQFFLWRFLNRELRGQQHPYSLSAAPGDRLRISVKNSGDGSALVAHVKPGTRVLAEGPLGVFTHSTRTRGSLLLVAAGIGVTPIRAMIEDPLLADSEQASQVTVVVRARSREEAPLLDELQQLADERGIRVHVVWGPRGATWGSKNEAAAIGDYLGSASDTDVYICGPREWAGLVAADAVAAGVHPDAVRFEEFGW